MAALLLCGCHSASLEPRTAQESTRRVATVETKTETAASVSKKKSVEPVEKCKAGEKHESYDTWSEFSSWPKVCSDKGEWIPDEELIAKMKADGAKQLAEINQREERRKKLIRDIAIRVLTDKEMMEFVERGPDILDGETTTVCFNCTQFDTNRDFAHNADNQKRFDELILQQYRLRGMKKSCDEKCEGAQP